MPSTYSSLKFELIENGTQTGTWGTTTNNNIGTAIEQAITGMATLLAADFTANVATLTLANTNASQNARALALVVDAAALSAAGTINVPAIQKQYLIYNASSHQVTVKVSGQTGVVVPAGKRIGVYNNGTDVFRASDSLPVVTSVASVTSPWAWNSNLCDQQCITGLANSLTINADAGTPTNGQKTIFRIKDNGTARALTWTTGSAKSFRAIGITLPTTTFAGKTLYLGAIYNATDSRWDVLGISQEL